MALFNFSSFEKNVHKVVFFLLIAYVSFLTQDGMAELLYNGTSKAETLVGNCTGQCFKEKRKLFKASVPCQSLFDVSTLPFFKIRAKLNMSGIILFVDFKTNFSASRSKGMFWTWILFASIRNYIRNFYSCLNHK